ncbi:flagellar biosynthesis anti-sigma factor FlgM [Oceanirhabdus sp. W0125-5]|uniref:flagellar biosynthesis anti-sigma factor FlgM n=1 Tax=Oceanirhabdus sp. W0125-5 TaxID=2999116 RepID=UPI0022F34115|nr:flagellar biosynthesis anti-sigma factor FlgM [Oceanirhabdus sp. W0125-5]WBW95474.1 flagellar biosynthesis anti-sigma factor FlgM [Oceanirhabdus sp. W0125-5]
MKINGIRANYVNKYYNKNINKNTNTQMRREKDKVQISDIGRKLSKIDSLNREDREKLVNEIKEKVDNGTYKIDSNKIAKKIIGHIKGEEI